MKKFNLCLLAGSLVLLTACGGGGSSNNSSNSTTPENPVVTNQIPVAVAGTNQTVDLGASVQLNGGGSSDQNNDVLTYQWLIKEKPAQSIIQISEDNLVNPVFTPDVAGKYVIQLIVNDGKASSDPSLAEITVNKVNHAPVAHAGNLQNVTLGDLVTLDGSQSSDVDQDQLTYQWLIKEKPAQSVISLSNDKLVNPTFKPDLVGKYVLQLIVSDGKLNSEPNAVEINVVRGNAAPVAVISAIPAEIKVGTKHIFDATQSVDNDKDSLTYQWTLDSKPTDSTAQLSQAQTSQPSIIFDKVGKYIVGLVVNDGLINSQKVTETINVVRGNSAPVAVAGSVQTVQVGDTVTLDGSKSSDADNDQLTYRWSISSKPNTSTAALNNTTIAKPSFVADVAGTYVLSLIVHDGYVASQTSNVSIDVQAKPELVLTSTDAIWGNATTYKLPYNMNTTFQTSSTCVGNGCTQGVELAKYSLEAKGQNFTIVDVKTSSSNANYPAFFEGLTNSQIIQKGEKVSFGLRLTKTQYNAVEVTYSFTVKETGQTFSYKATGSTN